MMLQASPTAEPLLKVENLSVKAKDSPKIDLDYRIGVLNEDDKDMLIGMADELHAQFKQVVRARRPRVKDEASTFDGCPGRPAMKPVPRRHQSRSRQRTWSDFSCSAPTTKRPLSSAKAVPNAKPA